MPLSTVWHCFKAQTEIAHRTNTIPAGESYEGLSSVIEPKVRSALPLSDNIQACLQKRGVDFNPDPQSDRAGSGPITVFLFDIEGTTTPLPVVRQVMIPLAVAYVGTYAAAHFPADPAFVKHVAAAAAATAGSGSSSGNSSANEVSGTAPSRSLREAFEASKAANYADEAANSEVRAAFAAHFKQEVDAGSKAAYMKALQGEIWQEVFATGEHQTEVFPDVAEFFRYAAGPMQESWRIAIYSTASVAAQKLLFRHTAYGDLNPCISAYFDPSVVGTKFTPKSYQRIRSTLAAQLNVPSAEQLQILFFTDSTTEATAADASEAIDCSVLCVRPLNEWVPIDTMVAITVPFVTSFTQLLRPEEPVDYDSLVQYTMTALKSS